MDILRRPEGSASNSAGQTESAPLAVHGQLVATMTEQDLMVGEMTCLSDHPRTATVVAMGEGEILEIRRNVLYMLQRNPASREMLDRVYRQRALKDHLRSITLFEDLDEQERRDCVDFLRDRVSLLRVDPGQVIFRQGESVSRNNEFVGHFYMIRLGYVKVSSTFHGHERVMNYLGPNHFFGEIALLSKLPNLIDEHVPDSLVARRTATCTALDDVELVCIKGEHFSELILKYDKLRNKFVQICKAHLQRNREMLEPIGQPSAKFLDQGLFNSQTLLVLDLESCTRCDECTRACSDTHQGVVRLIREGLRFDKFLVASSCRSCQDPYCIVGCPVDSIHRTSSLEIVIEDHCIGCGQCAKNCPYGNINMHGYEETHEYPPESGRQVAVVRQRATTCDLCRNVVGPDEEVSCVYACPHHAAFRMSGAELQDIVAGKSHARADTSTRAALSR
jgi:Fe-S-cluster-containing hydrogenase component 2/CRP-like cAMP-binding protein